MERSMFLVDLWLSFYNLIRQTVSEARLRHKLRGLVRQVRDLKIDNSQQETRIVDLKENNARLEHEVKKRDARIDLLKLEIDGATGIITRDRERVKAETEVAITNGRDAEGRRAKANESRNRR
jgi:cob(I)alamin adenosyltransferase